MKREAKGRLGMICYYKLLSFNYMCWISSGMARFSLKKAAMQGVSFR